MRSLQIVLLSALCLFVSPTVPAHGDIEERIAELTEEHPEALKLHKDQMILRANEKILERHAAQLGEDDPQTRKMQERLDRLGEHFQERFQSLPDRVQEELTELWDEQEEAAEHLRNHDHEDEHEDEEHEDHGLREFLGDLDHRLDELEEAVSELFEMTEEALEDAGVHADEIAEDAKVQYFRLRNMSAAVAADTIGEILGDGAFRLAVDHDSNTIVLRAPEKIVQAANTLLQDLDRISAEEDSSGSEANPVAVNSKSLVIRVYWLADNYLDESVGDASSYLPGAVIEAVGGMGVQNPGIVSQSVATALLEDEVGASWQTESAATISNQVFRISCGGQLVATTSDRMPLVFNLKVSQAVVGGQRGRAGSEVCELDGSTQATLGHYLILGTANHVTDATPANAAGMRGGQGFGGGYGGGYGGYGGEGGERPAPPKLANTRFAFVVQVTEAQSFPAAD